MILGQTIAPPQEPQVSIHEKNRRWYQATAQPGAPRFDDYDKARRKAQGCGSGIITLIDRTRGEVLIVPTRCKQWSCPTCAPILRNLWQGRIAAAQPRRFITLTADPARFKNPQATYEAMKRALPKLVEVIRRAGIQFEYAAVWELHASGYPHLHLCQKGGYVPKALIHKTWDRLGIGYCTDIREITNYRGAASYVSKYVTKTVDNQKVGIELSRVIQVSKHFFEKTILPPRKRPDSKYTVIYTRRHASEIILYLATKYGYQIDQDHPGAAVRLYQPTDASQGVPQETLQAFLA